MNEGIRYNVLRRLIDALLECVNNALQVRSTKLNDMMDDPEALRSDIERTAVEFWSLKLARRAARFLSVNDQQAITKHPQLMPEVCKNLIDLIFGRLEKLTATEIRSVFYFINDEDANTPEELVDNVVADEQAPALQEDTESPSDVTLPAAAHGYILNRVGDEDKKRFGKYLGRMEVIVFDELSNEFGPDFPMFDGEVGENVDMRCRELLVRTHDLLHSDATEEEG